MTTNKANKDGSDGGLARKATPRAGSSQSDNQSAKVAHWSSCTNCLEKLETGQEVVAEPVENDGSLQDIIRRGNFRFYHFKCIKKVPGLNRLKKIEWVNYSQERQDRKEVAV